jgi:hypothetical protein
MWSRKWLSGLLRVQLRSLLWKLVCSSWDFIVRISLLHPGLWSHKWLSELLRIRLRSLLRYGQ